MSDRQHLLLLVLSLGAGFLTALHAVGGVFLDEFEDGVANGWNPIQGTWTIQEGKYVLERGAERGDSAAVALLASPWKIADGTISVVVAYDESSDGIERPLILFRMKDELNGYAIRIRGNEKHIDLGRLEGGTFVYIRGDAVDIMEADRPMEITVEVEGQFAFIYYNGELRMRLGDPDRKFEDPGLIGLGGMDIAAPVYFDNFRVEGEGVTQFAPDLRPVSPRGKLALRWAELKGF